MCGIAGKVHFDSKEISPFDLKLMSDKIAHRGPDDEGIYISPDKKIGLVNRRLAIIDLSSKGHMPLSYKNRYYITYNGECYNFKDERKKLEKLGHKFVSNTDTEVITALYDEYKEKCLDHMRGMFALAIYDTTEGVLFAARDRMGQKPFKYFFDGTTFIFASELKAILTQKEVKREPDYLAIHDYLTYGYVPTPGTGFVGIKKLPPAHYLSLNTKNNKLEIKRYWDINFDNKLELSENSWCTKIIDTLEESTRLRMISDVPLGAFLSGGVDSSAVVAAMAKFSPDPIKTFSIRFKEKRYDEGEFAEKIAKLYKTEHTELLAEPKSIEVLPTLAKDYEEPFADASAVITYMVSAMAKKHVTVVLNGDGGDENFAGYDRHLRIKRDVRVDKLGRLKTTGLGASRLVSRTSIGKRANKFLEKSLSPRAARYVSYNSYFLNKDKDTLYTDYFKSLTASANAYSTAENIFDTSGARGEDQGLYFDLTEYLPNDLLAKVDIASMAVSLEARSPLLDHHMVALAASIPYSLKVKKGETKYILKKALEQVVPKENLYRPKKGFSVPLDKWFEGDLNDYAKSKLLSKNTKTKDLFNREIIRKMLETHSEKNDFGPKLWSLLTLTLWFDSYYN